MKNLTSASSGLPKALRFLRGKNTHHFWQLADACRSVKGRVNHEFELV